MTPEEEALGRVVERLEALAIPYMVAGSVASSHHGRPRSTHDADIVIDPTPGALSQLVRELAAGGFYVDGRVAEDALRRRRLFNAIDVQSAFKIDLIIRRERPFSRAEFERRQPAELAGRTGVALATAEDEARVGEEGGGIGNAVGGCGGCGRREAGGARSRLHRALVQGARCARSLAPRHPRQEAAPSSWPTRSESRRKDQRMIVIHRARSDTSPPARTPRRAVGWNRGTGAPRPPRQEADPLERGRM